MWKSTIIYYNILMLKSVHYDTVFICIQDMA